MIDIILRIFIVVLAIIGSFSLLSVIATAILSGRISRQEEKRREDG